MTESEFMKQADETLQEIEGAVENVSIRDDLDLECTRHGNVLEIECIDRGETLVVNLQPFRQEIWLAATKTGGFHFQWQDNRWIDTRSGGELFTVLSQALGALVGKVVAISRP